MRRPISTPDPYTLREVAGFPAYRWPTGRTVSSPALTASTGVFVVAGQSNAANYAEGTYVTGSGVRNLNVFDGGTYGAADPLLGATGTEGSWLGRFGDKAIATGLYDRVVLIPIAVGATSILEWVAGGTLDRHLLVACRRAAAVGLPITAILWQQGESDHAMAAVTYRAHLQSIIDGVRAAGFSAPWLIGKSTMLSGVTSAAIRTACTDILNGADILAGADTDTLTGANRRAGDTHFSVAGADAAAGLWHDAVAAAL